MTSAPNPLIYVESGFTKVKSFFASKTMWAIVVGLFSLLIPSTLMSHGVAITTALVAGHSVTGVSFLAALWARFVADAKLVFGKVKTDVSGLTSNVPK